MKPFEHLSYPYDEIMISNLNSATSASRVEKEKQNKNWIKFSIRLSQLHVD